MTLDEAYEYAERWAGRVQELFALETEVSRAGGTIEVRIKTGECAAVAQLRYHDAEYAPVELRHLLHSHLDGVLKREGLV